jgi:hypothetical protein
MDRNGMRTNITEKVVGRLTVEMVLHIINCEIKLYAVDHCYLKLW